MLKNNNIDVNAESGYSGSALSELCERGCESTLGIRLVLDDQEIHIYKGSPANWAARNGQTQILEMILRHTDQDVHKVCDCCKNKLPIKMIARLKWRAMFEDDC